MIFNYIGTWPDGIEGGRGCGPIALFDRDTDDVIVFAPASEFMIASLEKTTTALRAGEFFYHNFF